MEKDCRPLHEWTVGEIKRLCRTKGNVCEGCPFWGGSAHGCYVGDSEEIYPADWDLDDEPSFGDDELAVLREFYRTGAITVERRSNGHIYWDAGSYGGVFAAPIGFLGSLQNGQRVILKAVVGGRNRGDET